MNYTKGQLVRSPKFGLGKVLDVSGDTVTVFFRDQGENPRRINVSTVPLEVPEAQSDPWLDNLDLSVAADARAKRYLTHQAAVDKFLRYFPLGFEDPKYIGTDKQPSERLYKVRAHELWVRTLNPQEFKRLLAEQAYGEVVRRAIKVVQRTNLLATFEKAALKDATTERADAERFASGLYDLIYGEDGFERRFTGFAGVLDQLPQPQTPLRWTVQTIFPFLALPKEHLFMKPVVTQEAARRRGFSLNYEPRPNWLTYSCLLTFGKLLMQDLAKLHPKDMIDIQSFIFVTGESENYA